MSMPACQSLPYHFSLLFHFNLTLLGLRQPVNRGGFVQLIVSPLIGVLVQLDPRQHQGVRHSLSAFLFSVHTCYSLSWCYLRLQSVVDRASMGKGSSKWKEELWYPHYRQYQYWPSC
ncbi:hypothetical protein V2G26_016509 [Clonostachys chloroleuca]